METIEIDTIEKKVNSKEDIQPSDFSDEQIKSIKKVKEHLPVRIEKLKEILKNIANEDTFKKRQYSESDKNWYYEHIWNDVLNTATSWKSVLKPIINVREKEFETKKDELKDINNHKTEMKYYKKLLDHRDQFGRTIKRERDKRKRIGVAKDSILTNLLQEPDVGNAIIYKSKKTGKEYKAYLKWKTKVKGKDTYDIEIIDEIEKINEETQTKKKKQIRTNFLTTIEPNEIKKYIKVRDLTENEPQRVIPKDVEGVLTIVNEFIKKHESLLYIYDDIIK